ncbi:hypothetical protein J1N35_025772 [Gossypium stocksii]|uniref:Reverse transcriptase Ty1/copia-type domain-containing protein n=1 Tax=Gossypium stocksii TaxID=47602 RepID=A0A9D3ZY57_9ROSI|nr:hypothetical protein J1N35_025772 [Gossypium stocksii]
MSLTFSAFVSCLDNVKIPKNVKDTLHVPKWKVAILEEMRALEKTGDDVDEIRCLKEHLALEFEIKDLGPLKYFFGMEVAQLKKGLVVSQKKYVIDLLKEAGMSGCCPADTPIDLNVKFRSKEG